MLVTPALRKTPAGQYVRPSRAAPGLPRASVGQLVAPPISCWGAESERVRQSTRSSVPGMPVAQASPANCKKSLTALPTPLAHDFNNLLGEGSSRIATAWVAPGRSPGTTRAVVAPEGVQGLLEPSNPQGVGVSLAPSP